MVTIAIHMPSKVITTCDACTLHINRQRTFSTRIYVIFYRKYSLIEESFGEHENALHFFVVGFWWPVDVLLYLFIMQLIKWSCARNVMDVNNMYLGYSWDQNLTHSGIFLPVLFEHSYNKIDLNHMDCQFPVWYLLFSGKKKQLLHHFQKECHWSTDEFMYISTGRDKKSDDSLWLTWCSPILVTVTDGKFVIFSIKSCIFSPNNSVSKYFDLLPGINHNILELSLYENFRSPLLWNVIQLNWKWFIYISLNATYSVWFHSFFIPEFDKMSISWMIAHV